MKIYIASSWKNQHAVELLTQQLRLYGHEVLSFVEKAVNDESRTGIKFDFEEWIYSDDGMEKFKFDIEGATTSDLVIYIGPAGTDAWAEVGAAYGSGIPVFGLYAKGEPSGLMRHMVKWFTNYRDILHGI